MATNTNDGGPAFPVVAENGLGHIADGMTLRDWFAGMALQGLCQYPALAACKMATLAGLSYETADAMLAARTPATER